MSRSVTEAFKRAAFAQETEEVFVLLVTISHPQLEGGPVRLCSDAVNVVSRGNIYLAYPFDVQLPMDADNQPMVARLTIDNIDRQIVAAIRSIATPAMVDLEIVRASAPDIVEASFPNFELTEVQFDALVISGQLSYKVLRREPWPQHLFTPGWFPGLF